MLINKYLGERSLPPENGGLVVGNIQGHEGAGMTRSVRTESTTGRKIECPGYFQLMALNMDDYSYLYLIMVCIFRNQQMIQNVQDCTGSHRECRQRKNMSVLHLRPFIAASVEFHVLSVQI